jgi:hypothetical protein
MGATILWVLGQVQTAAPFTVAAVIGWLFGWPGHRGQLVAALPPHCSSIAHSCTWSATSAMRSYGAADRDTETPVPLPSGLHKTAET